MQCECESQTRSNVNFYCFIPFCLGENEIVDHGIIVIVFEICSKYFITNWKYLRHLLFGVHIANDQAHELAAITSKCWKKNGENYQKCSEIDKIVYQFGFNLVKMTKFKLHIQIVHNVKANWYPLCIFLYFVLLRWQFKWKQSHLLLQIFSQMQSHTWWKRWESTLWTRTHKQIWLGAFLVNLVFTYYL